MSLQPSIRLIVAPNFHLELDWPKRVSLGATVEQSESGPVVHPSWRPASAEELSSLVAPESTAVAESLPCLCLFVLPVYLRTTFWNLLEQASEQGVIPPAQFSEFAAKVSDFLEFKEMRLPQGACCQLVISLLSSPETLAVSELWGLINLGENELCVVVLNGSARERQLGEVSPVRIMLAPGEGVRISAGVHFACDSAVAGQPIIMLTIRAEGSTSSSQKDDNDDGRQVP